MPSEFGHTRWSVTLKNSLHEITEALTFWSTGDDWNVSGRELDARRFVFVVFAFVRWRRRRKRFVVLRTVATQVQKSVDATLLSGFFNGNKILNFTCCQFFKLYNLDFPKFNKWKDFFLMPGPLEKCKKMLFLNQKYSLKLFMAFIIAHCCFSQGLKLDFFLYSFSACR